MFNRYWCLFSKRSSKIKIFIFGILPRDECCSVSRMLIKEINTILKCKCAFHSFNFIEQEQGWTNNKDTLDLSLLYHDKLHLIQKQNIKLSELIIIAKKTEVLVKILISTRCQTRNIISLSKPIKWLRPLN